MNPFLSKYPVIRALLQRYRDHNIEYAAVAPFQTLFSVLFPAVDGYAVNIEQSVNKDRYRVDLWIQRLDFEHSTLYPVLVGEGKGGGRSAKEVENQVCQRAKEAIEGHGMEGIFAVTWLGEGFRFWYVSAKNLSLEAQDGRGKKGQKSAYIMLDSAEGEDIVHLCAMVKDNLPLRAPPVVPSQNVPADFNYQMDPNQPPESSTQYDQDNMPNVNLQAADNSYPTENLEGQAGYATEADDGYEMDAGEDYEMETEAGPSTGTSRADHRNESKQKQVNIERRENNSGYKFAWKGSSDKVKTERAEWSRDGDVLTLKRRLGKYVVWGYKP